ncbi:MAG TPA: DinB family protein [Candidatus Angelobacter sp.]|jgi:uncharacterized damage-inducible protein DinB
MSSLQSVTIRDFIRYYRQCAEKIHALVDPLSDEQIWSRPYPYGNSVGHLLLHLTGNLSYYIGAEIGGTAYVRNRPLEFSDDTRHPKAALLRNFDAAIATVLTVLQEQSESDWDAPFAGKGMEFAGNRFFAFLQCAGHLSHHTGQVMYLCKEMERPKAATVR